MNWFGPAGPVLTEMDPPTDVDRGVQICKI